MAGRPAPTRRARWSSPAASPPPGRRTRRTASAPGPRADIPGGTARRRRRGRRPRRWRAPAARRRAPRWPRSRPGSGSPVRRQWSDARSYRASSQIRERRKPRLLVPVNALAAFVALLRLEAERRDRPRVKPGQPDRLAGLLAIAVDAFLDAPQSFIDLRDQLALPVACPQFQSPISLRRRPIGDVRMILGLLLQMRQGLSRFTQNIFFPVQKLLLEILALAFIHELFVL